MAKNSYRQLLQVQASACCPTCGQKVPDAGLRVDLPTSTVIEGDRCVRTQRRTAEVLFVLLEKFPHYVPRETIIARAWGRVDDAPFDRTVDAQASRIRIALRSLKSEYGIESTRGAGYRLAKRGEALGPAPKLASFARLQDPGWRPSPRPEA